MKDTVVATDVVMNAWKLEVRLNERNENEVLTEERIKCIIS